MIQRLLLWVFVLGIFALNLALPHTAAAASITSSALDHIIIQPNDRPTRVAIFTDQQFVATGKTAADQTVEGLTFTWSTEGNVGRINDQGIFTGERGGIGTVTVRNGALVASVGVVVKGIRPAEETPVEPTPPPTSTTVTQVDEGTTNADGTGETPSSDGAVQGATDENIASKESSTQQCTTMRAWLWLLVLLLYIVVLFAYFLSLGESRTLWWWFWPLLFTAAPLGLFFAVRCGSTHAWVPWTIGALALLISTFYLRVLRPSGTLPTPPASRS